jgi:hypothetical protein
MGSAGDESGDLQRVEQAGDVRRAPVERLPELALGHRAVVMQAPDHLAASAREPELCEALVHRGGRVRTPDVLGLVVLSVLTGALVATYAVAGAAGAGAPRAGIGSGIVGWFAIGCPVCNKLVVTLLGASGATSAFAPAQPFLGVAAVAPAVTALRVRSIRRGTCPLPAADAATCISRRRTQSSIKSVAP